MMEVEDIVTENKDLQKTMIQKDKVIEDMETQLERAATEAEVKLMKTVEKMRIEYQLMARSAVSTKMRKMTDYLSDRLRQQESLDTERDSSSQARQAELQDKLTDTHNELNTVRRRLKSTFSFIVDFFKLIILESEKELMSVKNQLDMREKMLKSEESLRKKLEFQMNKLTNSRICDR